MNWTDIYLKGWQLSAEPGVYQVKSTFYLMCCLLLYHVDRGRGKICHLNDSIFPQMFPVKIYSPLVLTMGQLHRI